MTGCGECVEGVLIDQTYGAAEIPPGAVPVQRCDTCRTFATDEDAAEALAELWRTTFGYAEAEGDEPGDWHVTERPCVFRCGEPVRDVIRRLPGRLGERLTHPGCVRHAAMYRRLQATGARR